jgi:signal transduction histidine kinase
MDGGVDVQVETNGPVPTLPAGTVHDLRMIARESATNARKHGAATRVTIRIEPSPTQLVMRITDNGCGFDVAAAANVRSGHFGCAGIRERARKLGAEVCWRSAAGKGTTVEVILPLSGTPFNSPRITSGAIKDAAGHPQPETAL